MDKPIVYSDLPSFDQFTQYVTQKDPVDMGEYVFVGIEVRTADYVFTEIIDELIAAAIADGVIE